MGSDPSLAPLGLSGTSMPGMMPFVFGPKTPPVTALISQTTIRLKLILTAQEAKEIRWSKKDTRTCTSAPALPPAGNTITQPVREPGWSPVPRK